jgi:epoxide hydrolase-like predicted phosphatase
MIGSTIKAIIFDYFGVICSDEYWRFVKEDRNMGAAFGQLANAVNLGQMPWRDFIATVAQKTGQSVEAVSELYKTERIDPQVMGYVAQLRKKGYKTAILTNAHHEFLEPVMVATKLNDLFDVIVISSREGIIKPAPEIFALTLQRLGVTPAEAIHIDDIQRHVEAAQAAGLHGIYYQNFEQMKRAVEALLHQP